MFDGQPDWLKEWELTWGTGLWALLLALLTFAVSSVAAGWVLVRLPADYFRGPPPPPRADRHLAVRWAARVGKNLLGLLLVAAGLLLSLPAVPGPGLLFLLIGLLLLDFPGKRRLERWLIGLPGVLAAVNRLRRRFGKAPLEVGGASPRSPTRQLVKTQGGT